MPDPTPSSQEDIAKKRKRDGVSAGATLYVVLLSALTLFLPQHAAAAKNDFVWLVNGDRITCDIKSLERGRLRVGTDSMGTVLLDWEDVVRLSSPDEYVVELASGERFRGTLTDPGTEGQIGVLLANEETVLNMADVVWIDPVKEGTFTDLWDGNVRVGLDYTKANNSSTFSGSFEARRRAEDFQVGIAATAFLRSQDGASDSRRANLELEYRRLLRQRRFRALVGQFERNDELGIDLRSLVGAGFGRFLVQTNRSLWAATAGAAVVNEQRAGDQASENQIEAYLNTRHEYFLYHSPKTTLNTNLTLFPGLTDSGRIRGNLAFFLRRELISDLFLELRLFGSYDNESPEEGAKSDYGLITSLGYSF